MRWAVVLVGVAWALSLVGISLGWLTLSVVLLVLVLGLIVRPQIESLAASVVLTSRPAYGVGDEIEVLGHLGEVIEVTNRSTVIRLRRRAAGPHPQHDHAHRDGRSSPRPSDPRRATLELAVDERADAAELERVVLAALTGVDEVLKEPAPVVLARSIDGGAAHVEARFWHGARISEESRARDRAVRVLLAALRAAGIPTATDQVTMVTDPAAGGPTPALPSRDPTR